MAPAVIAGLIAAGGLMNYLEGKNRTDAAADMYDTVADDAASTVTANQGDIDRYTAFMDKMYGGSNEAYQGALNDFLNSDVYTNDGFSFSGNIADYMDPYQNQRVQAAMDAINNSAAAGGNRFSSDYIGRVGAKQQALSSEAWTQAYDRLMRDRQQQLTEYNANSQNNWNNYNAQNDRYKTAVSLYGNDRDRYTDSMGTALSAGIANRTAGLQSQANAAAGSANIYANQPTVMDSIMNPMSSFLGSYYGGK